MEDRKGKYGLILPSKVKKFAQQVSPVAAKRKAPTANVFGDDSDSEESEGGDDWVQRTLKQSVQGSVQQKQATQVIKKALKEDPTVYQYDELYDAMETKREQAKEETVKEKKPKYIDKLLKAAEKRQQDFEARLERDVQKEREAEGDMYKDKESFVTGAYRKKMEEMEQLKEEQRRKDAIDDMVDVTKQKDLSGFYRHLYKQTIDSGPHKSAEDKKKEMDVSESSKQLTPDKVQLNPGSVKHSPPPRAEKGQSKKETEADHEHNKLHTQRERKREYSNENSVSETEQRRGRDQTAKPQSIVEEKRQEVCESGARLQMPERSAHGEKQLNYSSEQEDEETPSTPIPRKSIWEKRTIGQVFSDAVERYLERKNALKACVVLAK